jgi:hypothetical protein
LIDTQWVLCCSPANTSVFTRLRGLEDQEYELEVRGSLAAVQEALAREYPRTDSGWSAELRSLIGSRVHRFRGS